MGTRDLPDMYALSPRACGPRALGIHIRQITRAHVTTIKYTVVWFKLAVGNIHEKKFRGKKFSS